MKKAAWGNPTPLFSYPKKGDLLFIRHCQTYGSALN